MERKIVTTEDGSHTLYVEGLNEHYHSTYGALQESMHIYIGHGLKPLLAERHPLNIFEMGFGTGLNALLTIIEAGDIPVHYTSIEAYPITADEIEQLNHTAVINHPYAAGLYRQIHEAPWGEDVLITPTFTLRKIHAKLIELDFPACSFDLVYYDAFAPSVQPELWTKEVFEKIASWMKPLALLATYCAKGEVKRILTSLGFELSHPAGPPGKKEITVAKLVANPKA